MCELQGAPQGGAPQASSGAAVIDAELQTHVENFAEDVQTTQASSGAAVVEEPPGLPPPHNLWTYVSDFEEAAHGAVVTFLLAQRDGGKLLRDLRYAEAWYRVHMIRDAMSQAGWEI